MAPKKASSIIGLEELTNNKNGLGKALVAEALGVFFINYFGCLSCLKPDAQHISFTVARNASAGVPDENFTSSAFSLGTQTVVIALSFGLVIFVLVQVRDSIPALISKSEHSCARIHTLLQKTWT